MMEEKKPIQLTEDQPKETDNFWEDPRKVLALIDLLFLDEDGTNIIPS